MFKVTHCSTEKHLDDVFTKDMKID